MSSLQQSLYIICTEIESKSSEFLLFFPPHCEGQNTNLATPTGRQRITEIFEQEVGGNIF